MVKHKILRADLHVHSKYSDRPSEWILKALGTRESYTEPEEIYRICKKNGMDIVTITDHNSIEGALILKRNHPEDVILGSELTTYFPENGCKIHCLVYGFTEEQFLEMDKLRKNIYELREYIKVNDIVHSVAHATYSINNKLQYEQLERLILLFDSFEVINGARNSKNNLIWGKSLANLGPEHIERLQAKHND
ncbi:MAG: phosphoesterase, partial [Candidatus Riflemargulisbacteria bacterium]